MALNDQYSNSTSLKKLRLNAKPGDLQASMTSLIELGKDSFTRLTNPLRSLLQEVISKTNSTQGRICLKDTMPGAGEQERAALLLNGGMSEAVSQRRLDKCAVCAAFYERNRIDPLIVHDGKPSVHCSRMRRTAGSSVAIPIRYRESVLGVMTLTSNRENHYSETLLEICQRFTHEMAYLIKRYQRHDLIKATLDKDLVFMGTSDALGKVDRFLKKASQVDLPVLIVGEFGSEKMYIACSLHCEGPRRDHPFVEVGCPSYESHMFKSEVYDLFRQADGGTIFLKGIDELEYKLQYQLAELIESAGEPRTGHTKRSKLNEVRIVASASRDPERLVEEGKFCPSLLGKIDFLKIRIAPLRERREDIEPLIEYFLRKYTGERTHHISDEVLKLCQAYDWPSNVDEIERVIARLAVMA